MNETFTVDAARQVSDGTFRVEAAKRAATMPLPSEELEDWRYSPANELDFSSLQPVTSKPQTTIPGDQPSEGASATVSVVDGWVVSISIDEAWQGKGLEIKAGSPPPDRSVEDETIFDVWHQAFCPEVLEIRVPAGLAVTDPVIIRSYQSGASAAGFPAVDVSTGESSELAVIEYQTSASDEGLTVSRVDQTVAAASNLVYVTVQDLSDKQTLINRLQTSVGSQARAVGGYATFGGRYARVRSDVRLEGRGALGELVAAYYADGDQVHDFRTFQHHQARDTKSDLLFKGAMDDKSGSIYTGMIQIHPEGAGSNAFQTNRNIKLSEDAWAWSVPNLGIENNDVRCSHASTVNPLDEDQQFYLQARGVPPTEADRLIVAGFFDEALNRLPGGAGRAEAQRLIAEKLGERES